MKGMPAEAGRACALTYNGCRTVGKDIPPVYKLYRRFVSRAFWILVHQNVKTL